MADVATRLPGSHNRVIMQFDNRILDDIAARLEQTTKQERLFTVRWRLT